MATLASLSHLDSERGQAALALLLTDDPFMRHLEQVGAWNEDATEFDYRVDTGSSTVQTRARAGSYTPAAETPEAKLTGAQAFHGDSIAIDESDLEDARRGLRDISAWIDGKLRERVKDWGRKYVTKLWNGTGSGGNIKGLNIIVDGATDIPGYTGYKAYIDATDFTDGADVLDLTNKDNWPAFMRLWHTAKGLVESPTGVHVNKEFAGILNNIAQQYGIQGESRDLFGVSIDTIGRLPIIEVRDGCITNAEPDNATTPVDQCTSLWITAFAEDDFDLVSNSGLAWKDFDWLESKVSGKFEWEVRAKWRPKRKNKLIRVGKIKVV